MESLRLEQRLLGRSVARQGVIFPWPQIGADELRRDYARAEPTAQKFDFIVVDEAAGVMRIRPGLWFVREDLIVPAGRRLRESRRPRGIARDAWPTRRSIGSAWPPRCATG